MPLVTIESSVHLAGSERARALAALAASINASLAIAPPTVLRLRIADVDPEAALIGDATASPEAPWVVAHAYVLEGRAPEQIAAFIPQFSEAIASSFGVDADAVRVLVHPVAKAHWGLGRRTAAALGR